MKIVLDRTIVGRILDIGGGGEGIIGRLYGEQVTAIDNCPEELEEVPGGFEKIWMDATALTFGDNSFDCVTSFYTLMFMRSQEQRDAIREAVRVLRPGGELLIWDAEIECAYPEPFCTGLDITLPKENIHTTYGVVKLDSQSAASITEMCIGAGLRCVSAQSGAGHFHLCFQKPQK